MFHEAQEWKWVQTFHALMVATAVHAADWSFRNNLWLITLWPHCCTLRSPVRLFMRCPDICLAGLQSDNLWFVSICNALCALFFIAESGPKSARKGCGVQCSEPSLWDCTEGWDQRRGKDSSSCDPSLSLYLLSNVLHFLGGRRWTETCQACNDKYTVLCCYFFK